MARDNYRIQMEQAQQRFLTYDQDLLIRKLKLSFDDRYLYPVFLGSRYRICRKSGALQRQAGETWVDANTFAEVLTLYDLVCDSREDRFLSGQWKNMADFGLLFHRGLLETARDPWAEKFDRDPEGFRRACLALKGRPLSMGDAAYAIELFDGLEIVLQLWFGDEEFPANLRTLWDANAAMYIKYETMHYARGLLLSKLEAQMK